MRVRHLPVAEGRELNISRFPNFTDSGSVNGMKKKSYGEDTLPIRCGGYIYCGGNLNRNKKKRRIDFRQNNLL